MHGRRYPIVIPAALGGVVSSMALLGRRRQPGLYDSRARLGVDEQAEDVGAVVVPDGVDHPPSATDEIQVDVHHEDLLTLPHRSGKDLVRRGQ